ncbi:phosphopyruvate hydratase [Candidatus Uhrbacteria bacterium CG10_big_fil_rev_8_21_14_0_10_50_16]|uniref:Enolase n=1 Tax=Candidatus Uhrbacteria bacterium CG10_big_fil_rev_8_21_14_0_10_50_16 TaxID=1975039 RepID=A0A2H0RMC0_9BACT|nr:MAG: phosphopyruvate hydratase [Candidatus Uhrbacteria bacterium CG10_big_fil_rev_8_21_14_0_10_50_16]
MSDKIDQIHAHEILDSRGNPTVAVSVLTRNGVLGTASVPSGASTGSHEAWELRDGDPKRYGGKGVKKACRNVNMRIAPKLRGMRVTDQRGIDDLMIQLDGTVNKKRLGANAILGVSLAVAHAAAKTKHMPLYAYLRWTFDILEEKWKMPVPLMNILNGGSHADTNLDIQEFIVAPTGIRSFRERVRAGSEIFHALGDILHAAGLDTDVGNEGGYAPNLGKTEDALIYIMKAIKKAGYVPGKQIRLGLDVAANEFYNEKKDRYVMRTDKRKMTDEQMIDLIEEWVDKYPFVSIEDGLQEDKWEAWEELTRRLGKKVYLIGDDLFVTNADRLQTGIDRQVANAILIKFNQIGTLSETIQTIQLAQANKYKVIISHRSGETTDTTLADLAVAVNADFVKTGAPSRSERLVKYNRLMEIEEELLHKK